MDIRLIASDVDGTMLPRGGCISQGLRDAIERCRQRAIPFIIASGRWIGALGEVVRQAGTRGMPMIIANGAAVVDGDGVPMREWLMSDQDVKRAYAILREFDVQINGYVRDGLYCVNTKALKRQSTMIRDYIGGGDYRLVRDDIVAFESEALHGAYKLEALVEDADVISRVRDALADTGLEITHSSWRNVEIMAPGTGKGEALKWLCSVLNVSPEACMAFGDSANDMDLLGAAGWPVAMGNADPQTRKMARIIAPADVEDGVARVICQYVLNQETNNT